MRSFCPMAFVAPIQDPEAVFTKFVRFDAGFLLSQTMLDITFVDKELLGTIQEACGFNEGELFSFHMQSFPTFQCGKRRAQWWLTDVASGRLVSEGYAFADETFEVIDKKGSCRDGLSTRLLQNGGGTDS